MTIGVGHPDWQSYAQWRAGVVQNQTVPILPGASFTTPAVNVTNWQALLLIGFAQTAGVTIDMQVAPSVNAAPADWTTQQQFKLPPGSNVIEQLVQVIDRAVRFKLTNTHATATATVQLAFYAMNTTPTPQAGIRTTNSNYRSNITINAGANLLLNLPFQGNSRCRVSVFAVAGGAATLAAQLWEIDEQANRVGLVGSWVVNPQVDQNLWVPPGPLQLGIFNNSAGAINSIYPYVAGVL